MAACKDTPVEAASEMIAMRFQLPFGRWDRPDHVPHARYATPALGWVSTLRLDRPEPGTILVGGPGSDGARARPAEEEREEYGRGQGGGLAAWPARDGAV